MESAIAMTQVAVIAMILIHAAYSDVRTRRVSDRHWAVMSAICIPLGLIADPSVVGIIHHLAVSMLAAYMLSARIVGRSAAVIVSIAVILFTVSSIAGDGTSDVSAMSMFALFWFMYRSGVLPGGADAKCLMTVSLLLPVMPDWTMQGLAPFPLALLTAVVASVSSLSFAAVNLSRSRMRSASGYVRRVEEIDPIREVPLERMIGGELRRARVKPFETQDVLDELRSARIDSVRATFLVPFVLPIAASFLLIMMPVGA